MPSVQLILPQTMQVYLPKKISKAQCFHTPMLHISGTLAVTPEPLARQRSDTRASRESWETTVSLLTHIHLSGPIFTGV